MRNASLSRAIRSAPLGSSGLVLAGLEHAPELTLGVLNGLAAWQIGEWGHRVEDQYYQQSLVDLMSKCGPWQYGPETASRSRTEANKLSGDRLQAVLIDPYYFNHALVHIDESEENKEERLVTYAYRLRPIGTVALNYDIRQSDPRPLVESLFCVSFLQGTTLYGDILRYTVLWLEGNPLGAECLFEIPRWGILRAANDPASYAAVWDLFEKIQGDLERSGISTKDQIEALRNRFETNSDLPSPVERGFPNLQGTPWFGSEPFPELDNFEYQLIGDDLRYRHVSVPSWFRPRRGGLL